MEAKIKKQLATLIGFNAISSFADGFFYLILLSFVTQEIALKNMIPLVSMSETLPFFLSVFIGTLADRTRRKRKYLIYSSVIRIIIYLSILYYYLGASLFAFVVSACLLNVASDICGKYGGSLQIPVIKLLIPDGEKMEQIQGLNSAVGQIGTIMGTLIGGFLFARFTLAVLLVINIFLFGIVLIVTVGIIYQCKGIYETIEANRLEEDFNFFLELQSTIQLVFKIKKLRGQLILISITNTLLSLTLMVVSMMESGEDISGQLSIIQTLQIVFMILGSILVGTVFKKVRLSNLFILFFGSYLIFLVLIMSNKLDVAMVLIALFSLILGLITPKFMTAVISSVSVKNIGGFVGTVNTLIMLAPFVNTIFLQILMQAVDITRIIFIYVLITIMAAGLSVFMKIRNDKV